jgi:uncharacterized protein (DUF58 family)
MKEKVFDGNFHRKLESISLKARMSMTEGAAGGRKSKVKGSSVELSDFREYVPGDDYRRIDWNAYGRFEKLFLKLFMEEREALINIFVDSSKSMDFGDKHKGHMALRVSAILAYLALNNLDRVVLNRLQGENLVHSSSYLGKSSFQKVIQFLEATEFNGNTNIAKAIKRRDLKIRGISVVISDFFTLSSIEEAVKYLAYKKQQIVFIQVLSEEEVNPTFRGQVRLIDSETKEEVNITITPKLLKTYRAKLKAQQANLKELTQKYGGVFLQISSADSIEKIVFDSFAKEGII